MLLLKSTGARMLAVRRVTQGNRRKKAVSIDGRARHNQKERL
jgi:RNA-directed DNA polymerase